MSLIHFAGIGNMGLPMAINLHNAGCNIAVYDLSEQQRKSASEHSIALLEADQLGNNADVVITMLPSGEQVRSAVIEADIASRMRPRATLIDSSTIDLQTTIELASYSSANGIHCLDAPVSGGVAGANAGTLTFMAGGNQEVFEQHKSLLEIMGKNVFYAGGHGAGQTAKMCNNMMLAISMVGVSEALNLGNQMGVDVGILSEIMRNASGNNWPLQVYNPWPGVMAEVPASNDYRNGFKSNLMLKDLTLAQRAALSKNVPVHLGSLVRSLYATHCLDPQQAESDFSSILKHYTDGQPSKKHRSSAVPQAGG